MSDWLMLFKAINKRAVNLETFESEARNITYGIVRVGESKSSIIRSFGHASCRGVKWRCSPWPSQPRGWGVSRATTSLTGCPHSCTGQSHPGYPHRWQWPSWHPCCEQCQLHWEAGDRKRQGCFRDRTRSNNMHFWRDDMEPGWEQANTVREGGVGGWVGA